MKSKNDILIKVLSLGVGLAVGIVLIAKVFFELSYDSFYKDLSAPLLSVELRLRAKALTIATTMNP